MSNLSVNAIRALSIDAINKSKSGHPGICLGAAPMAYTLFTKHLKANPKDSQWFNRDRFVLSAGHGSMLLYSLLHLSGYKLSIEDLKQFRQWGSLTPGHPEVGHTDGVDATSGPLGQGIPTAVGMAMAEAFLAAKFNQNDLNVVDHYTYALCGDGDLQEGATSEASQLAGHLKLGKLIVLFDSNDITLDGDLKMSFSGDIKKRYEAYGWQVIVVEDGNDIEAIDRAIIEAKADISRPTLIEIKTIIGYGSSKQGSSATHGAPLGQEDGDFAKANYGWTYAPFEVPEEVYEDFKKTIQTRGKREQNKWKKTLKQLEISNSILYTELMNAINGTTPIDFEAIMPNHEVGYVQATRNSSHDCINAIANNHTTFIGGSADLSKSCMTTIKTETNYEPGNYAGRNINYGIREFGMAIMNNGMLLHGGVRTFGATFFVFSDYAKPAVKMAALAKIPSILVFTHDSIAVGEDGPTHEPVEQMAMFRAMPNVNVIRPCDANETAAAWQIAMETTDRPTVLVLSRQNLRVEANSNYENVKKGAYIASKEQNNLDAILIATGSEVNLAIDAQKALLEKGIDVRVVSMPSFNLFEAQTKKYQKEILPPACKNRVGIEMLSSFGWDRYIGSKGKMMAVDIYGASAPGDVVIKNYGFTVEAVMDNVSKLVKK